MKRYSAALVGLGRIGFSLGLDKKREQPASHTAALLANPRINLIAGCDTDHVVLADWHDANRRAAAYANSSALYAQCKPDLITVAVNEEAHLEEALDAIGVGPRLLILEKPVALNVADALQIQQAADKNHVSVLVNHERRFAEDFKAAKSYMKNIGELQSIRAELWSGLAVYDPAKEETGGYSLLHDGTHLVDAVLFFLEEDFLPSTLKKIRTQNSNANKSGLLNLAEGLNESEHEKIQQELSSHDVKTVNSLLRFPVVTGVLREENKVIRQLSAHYTTAKCPDVTIAFSGRSKFFGFEIVITGTEGRICIGNGYLKFYRKQKSPLYSGFYSLLNDKTQSIPKRTLYFSNMVQNAVNFLDGKERIRSTITMGINALSVLEEIKNIVK